MASITNRIVFKTKIPSHVVVVAAATALPPGPAAHLLLCADAGRARRDVLGVAVLVDLDDGRVGGARAAVQPALLPQRAAVVPEEYDSRYVANCRNLIKSRVRYL